MCRSCHVPATHTGPAFTTAWQRRPPGELFRYVRELMPKNEPGILTPRKPPSTLAYLLRMNGMPSGGEELPADSTTLSRIRIELRAIRDPR